MGVTSYRANSRQKVSLVPIGPGEEIPVLVDGLEDRLGNVVAWLPEGHRYLVRRHQRGKPGRIFLWDSTNHKLTPVSPEGTAFNDLLPAPDGSRFPAQGPDGNWFVYRTVGSAARPVPGIAVGERSVNGCDDGKSVYVTATADGAKSFPVSRLDLATSRKIFWKQIKPANPVDSVFNLRITPDGRSYAYNYSRTSGPKWKDLSTPRINANKWTSISSIMERKADYAHYPRCFWGHSPPVRR